MSRHPKRSLARYIAVIAIVAGLDLLTKGIAARALGSGTVSIAGPLDFALVHNRGSAFGIWLGPYTWQLNALATITALCLSTVVVRALSSVDRLAPIALGLIAGAAIGNLTSLLMPPAGVPDFIAVSVSETGRLVMNLADIAAYAGLAMTARSVHLLSRAIGAPRPAQSTVMHDMEVAIPLVVEGHATAVASGARRDWVTTRPPKTDAPHGSPPRYRD